MNKPLTVWIFQTGEPLHMDAGDPRPMRAMNVANALVDRGHKVVLWSSAFYHQEKRHRTRSAQRISISPQLEIRLVPSPGYQRNIGPGRLWDHAVFAYNLSKWLKKETTAPDVGFIGYPPIETAAVMTRWLSARGVPCMLDVKDQWPTIFLNALPRPLRALGSIALAPYFYFAQRAMREATAVSAMAKDFLAWALNFGGRPETEFDLVVPLTMPTRRVCANDLAEAGKWWDSRGVLCDGRPRVCFVGSHSAGFDFASVVEAARSMAGKKNPCQFVICGNGVNNEAWRRQAEGIDNIYFPGWVDRAQIEALAGRSLAALAPYNNSPDFVMSVPNKIIDYLSLGLPILSPLHGEVASLLVNHTAGLMYGSKTDRSLIQCIEMLIENSSLHQQMAANALALYREKFSFDIVYGGLVQHLEMLARVEKPLYVRDNLIERDRYDDRAKSFVTTEKNANISFGSSSIPIILRRPYICYEDFITEYVKPTHKILEIGSGIGMHTGVLIRSGANVTATDISLSSLEALKKLFHNPTNLYIKSANMENLPFPDASFDVVTCAGSLSYGDNGMVMNEVHRLLKNGGVFIAVDSLNNNIIYRFNRYLHYLKNNRTWSTLERMPNLKLIDLYNAKFDIVVIKYFGSLSWLSPFISLIVGQVNAAKFSDEFDIRLHIKKSAFKFCMVAKKSMK